MAQLPWPGWSAHWSLVVAFGRWRRVLLYEVVPGPGCVSHGFAAALRYLDGVTVRRSRRK
jgi:hypothetical protein